MTITADAPHLYEDEIRVTTVDLRTGRVVGRSYDQSVGQPFLESFLRPAMYRMDESGRGRVSIVRGDYVVKFDVARESDPKGRRWSSWRVWFGKKMTERAEDSTKDKVMAAFILSGSRLTDVYASRDGSGRLVILVDEVAG